MEEMTLSPFVESPLELVRADQFLEFGEDVQAKEVQDQLCSNVKPILHHKWVGAGSLKIRLIIVNVH